MKVFRKKENYIPRLKQKQDKKNYIIHHYCPHTFNAGDHFVIRSIRKHLKDYLENAVFIPKASAFNRGWGKPVRLTGENIDFSNKYADAVIVGGSDQYNNWSLRIKAKEIRHLIPPLYLIGLGASSQSTDSLPHIKKQVYFDHIKAANEFARLSSVRDNYTDHFLKNLGYNGAVVTGCPAMYLFDTSFHLKENGPVALTFPFPVIRKKDDKRYIILIETIKYLIEIIKKNGLLPVISCHDDRDVPNAADLFGNENIFFSNYVDDYFDFYQNCSMVIGSRLHASILAAGMGKPFININLDARGIGFSKTFSLEKWNLFPEQDNFKVLLENRLSTILRSDLDIFKTFYQIKKQYKTVFLNFMRDVAQDIEKIADHNQ